MTSDLRVGWLAETRRVVDALRAQLPRHDFEAIDSLVDHNEGWIALGYLADCIVTEQILVERFVVHHIRESLAGTSEESPTLNLMEQFVRS